MQVNSVKCFFDKKNMTNKSDGKNIFTWGEYLKLITSNAVACKVSNR